MRYRPVTRTVAAARWASGQPSASIARAEWEGFCLIHRLVPRGQPRRSRSRAARTPVQVPAGWQPIDFSGTRPWVVVDVEADGSPLILRFGDAEFRAAFEPDAAAEHDRVVALLAWARHQFDRAQVDAEYLRGNESDLQRPPWNDPVLSAERRRVTALVTESGRPYHQTHDPEQPERTPQTPPTPSRFRVAADAAAVLAVLLDQPVAHVTQATIRERSGLRSWVVASTLDRLRTAGWVHRDTAGSPDIGTWQWWLTDTGVELARQRLAQRAGRGNGESR